MKMRLNATDEVNYSQFDQNFENIFILKNLQVLEKRNTCDDRACSMCAIRGGYSSRSFYLVDLSRQTQSKLTSRNLKNTYAPCFINGETDFVAVADKAVEIRSTETKNGCQAWLRRISKEAGRSWNRTLESGVKVGIGA